MKGGGKVEGIRESVTLMKIKSGNEDESFEKGRFL